MSIAAGASLATWDDLCTDAARVRWRVGGMADQSAYEAIAAALFLDIEEGRLRPGDRLPSEAALRQQHGVTPTTIRRALQELEIAGLTRGEVGRGVFVRSYDRAAVEAAAACSVVEAAAQPVEVSLIQPAPNLVELLPGTTSLVRRRSSTHPGLATYYPRHLVERIPALGEPAALSEPDEDLLANAGIVITGREAEVVGRMPTRWEAGMLGLVPGTPVLEVVVALADADGAVQVVREALYAGDRYRLRFRMR
ncbi:GntR family transcriptional regulator [Nonomuraea sp. NPDC050394]|uniref:GntR family transcriptional regulator n=1 Tax=Nonomuraea sp. NPDC050394 TaxID=3364363 RepID=UPI00378E22C0